MENILRKEYFVRKSLTHRYFMTSCGSGIIAKWKHLGITAT